MPVVTTMARLQVAPHVRACRCEGQVILLDLQRGRYLGIGREQADALIGHVEDWPRDAGSAVERTSSIDIDKLRRHLLSLDLLTPAPTKGMHGTALPEATSTLPNDTVSGTGDLTAARAIRLLSCTAATSLWMRFRSMQSIAQAVASRRLQAPSGLPGAVDLDATRRLVAAYERLRPLALTARDRCVHDSLTLLSFLAAEGVFPHWVIGVKTAPFGAHSWVQSGSTVLNDLHENVRRYRPILIV